MKNIRGERAWLALAASFCLAFQLCSAQNTFTCSVTRNKTQTTYRALDESRPPEYQECFFFWCDGKGQKLADNSNKIQSVTESSISFLVSSDCIEKVVCKQQCTSKINGMLFDFIVNCETSCADKDSAHGDNDSLDQGEAKDGKPTLKIIAGLGGLAGLAVLIFVLWKFRNRIRSTFSFSQLGARYLPGKPQNADPNPPVVLGKLTETCVTW